MKCSFCDRSFSRASRTKFHQNYCPVNPNRVRKENQYSVAKRQGKTFRMSEESRRKMAQFGSTNSSSRESVRRKISESQIKYLKDHPDRVPYLLNHSSKRSYPELVFENALKSAGISGWVSHYRNSVYQYDFAFLDEKIDVEIDGATHKTEKVRKIDAKRDDFSKTQSWRVVRFDAETVLKDVNSCVERLASVRKLAS